MNRFVPAGWGDRDWSQPLTVRVVHDGPGECTCTALPPGHNDDQCAAELFRRAAAKRRCWCGRLVSHNGIECAEHDDPPEEAPDPEVCGDCPHQRAFHFPEHDGHCFGHDCDCPGFQETA